MSKKNRVHITLSITRHIPIGKKKYWDWLTMKVLALLLKIVMLAQLPNSIASTKRGGQVLLVGFLAQTEVNLDAAMLILHYWSCSVCGIDIEFKQLLNKWFNSFIPKYYISQLIRNLSSVLIKYWLLLIIWRVDIILVKLQSVWIRKFNWFIIFRNFSLLKKSYSVSLVHITFDYDYKYCQKKKRFIYVSTTATHYPKHIKNVIHKWVVILVKKNLLN